MAGRKIIKKQKGVLIVLLSAVAFWCQPIGGLYADLIPASTLGFDVDFARIVSEQDALSNHRASYVATEGGYVGLAGMREREIFGGAWAKPDADHSFLGWVSDKGEYLTDDWFFAPIELNQDASFYAVFVESAAFVNDKEFLAVQIASEQPGWCDPKNTLQPDLTELFHSQKVVFAGEEVDTSCPVSEPDSELLFEPEPEEDIIETDIPDSEPENPIIEEPENPKEDIVPSESEASMDEKPDNFEEDIVLSESEASMDEKTEVSEEDIIPSESEASMDEKPENFEENITPSESEASMDEKTENSDEDIVASKPEDPMVGEIGDSTTEELENSTEEIVPSEPDDSEPGSTPSESGISPQEADSAEPDVEIWPGSEPDVPAEEIWDGTTGDSDLIPAQKPQRGKPGFAPEGAANGSGGIKLNPIQEISPIESEPTELKPMESEPIESEPTESVPMAPESMEGNSSNPVVEDAEFEDDPVEDELISTDQAMSTDEKEVLSDELALEEGIEDVSVEERVDEEEISEDAEAEEEILEDAEAEEEPPGTDALMIEIAAPEVTEMTELQTETKNTFCNAFCVESETNQLLFEAPSTQASIGKTISFENSEEGKNYVFDSLGVFQYIEPESYQDGEAPTLYTDAQEVVEYNLSDLSCTIKEEPDEDMTIIYYVMSKTVDADALGQIDELSDNGLKMDYTPFVAATVLGGVTLLIQTGRRKRL